MNGQPAGDFSQGDGRADKTVTDSTHSELADIVDVLRSIDEKLQFIVNAVRDINARG